MTPARNQRIREVLAQRQSDLSICMDKVHKTHNLSAIIRTAEAVGVHHVHTVWLDEKNRLRRGTSMGTHNWMQMHDHDDIESVLSQAKQQGQQILVSHLSSKAVDFRDIDYTRPSMIIMGQEKYGASQQAIDAADAQIIIPMMGMVESLNVSVASALILYEAQRQRQLAGMYQQQRLPETEQQRLLFLGGYPRLYHLCEQKQLPFPSIDAEGQIVASEKWWYAMQHKN